MHKPHTTKRLIMTKLRIHQPFISIASACFNVLVAYASGHSGSYRIVSHLIAEFTRVNCIQSKEKRIAKIRDSLQITQHYQHTISSIDPNWHISSLKLTTWLLAEHLAVREFVDKVVRQLHFARYIFPLADLLIMPPHPSVAPEVTLDINNTCPSRSSSIGAWFLISVSSPS